MSQPSEQERQTQGLAALRQRLAAHPLMRPDRLPSIGRELAYAVSDIRMKLEEAAYGHPVTPETIHGRAPEGGSDPLGRSAVPTHLADRCRQAHDDRQQHAPARGHEPDR